MNIKRTLQEYKRIISISRKPTKEEFKTILKICGLGIAIIGTIGFGVQIVYQFIIAPVI